MTLSSIVCQRWFVVTSLLLSVVLARPASAQEQELAEDMVGQNQKAWVDWSAAMKSLEREDTGAAGKQLEALAGMKISELRLALMAERTGIVRFEAWAEKDDAPQVVKDLLARIQKGREQKGLAEDGWHAAAVGRFDIADASFKAIDEANPDPVALLELARKNQNRHLILIKLLNNAQVGPSAGRFLQILNQGEEMLREDPTEIVVNIGKLGGSPRQVYEATKRLKDSGEYAIPHLIQALRDPNRTNLHPAIIKVLPQIGRGAMNPLCIALGLQDDVTRQVLIEAAAELGYKQVIPYLAKVVADDRASGEVRASASAALGKLGASAEAGVSGSFYNLADAYYKNIDSVRADTTKETANVWYLRDKELKFIRVPTPIFDDIMAMRSCEEALNADANNTNATALWLAANIRREAKLGLDVESDQPHPLAEKDSTRPEKYPRSIYFARAAGPLYNHMVLARAFADRDPGVALGAIAALSATAGELSLVGAEDVKQPLVQTLTFPNRQVRIKAALALARALPKTSFAGADNVVPVLAEALAQSGKRAALVVDGDENTRNKFQAVLRSAGYECGVGANLYQARENGEKAQLTSYDVILLASDIQQPDLGDTIAELRKQFQTAATPILVLAKEGQLTTASKIARTATGAEVILSDVLAIGDPKEIQQQVASKISRASQALGMSPLSPDMSLDLALQAAETLRGVLESNLKVYAAVKAAPQLVLTLDSRSETLRIKCAHALALVPTRDAQAAIGAAALNAERGEVERVATFGSLAESARRNGNLLGDHELISRLIEFTMKEENLILRSAASKALGALDLPSNKASEIIRAQYRG